MLLTEYNAKGRLFAFGRKKELARGNSGSVARFRQGCDGLVKNTRFQSKLASVGVDIGVAMWYNQKGILYNKL